MIIRDLGQYLVQEKVWSLCRFRSQAKTNGRAGAKRVRSVCDLRSVCEACAKRVFRTHFVGYGKGPKLKQTYYPENGATSCNGREVSLGVAFVSSFTSPTDNAALSRHFFRLATFFASSLRTGMRFVNSNSSPLLLSPPPQRHKQISVSPV